ncbi:PREDICTED: breast carcinoma-amplified sequence 4, partial [Phaethon lepturus]|uniref:breast carcinoma-amplified sequence 4 n=1 Tax=Phaethon lepturus TaxID=97097 RepID=UPI00053084CB
IRGDTSEILDKTIPLIKEKVMEMNHIYAKVDKLEAFVKMVAHHVSFLEEQVLEAEKSHGTFLNTVCKLFQCATISSFKNASWNDNVSEQKRKIGNGIVSNCTDLIPPCHPSPPDSTSRKHGERGNKDEHSLDQIG